MPREPRSSAEAERKRLDARYGASRVEKVLFGVFGTAAFVAVALAFSHLTATGSTPIPPRPTTATTTTRCVPHPSLPDVKVCKEGGKLIAYHHQGGQWAYMGEVRPFNLQLPAAAP